MNDTQFRAGVARMKAQLSAVGQSMRRMGLVGVGAGFAAAPVVSVFASFDDAIRAAGARAEATAGEFEAMRAKALELGKTSGFTAAQVANLMNELATAGFRPDQINEMTAAVLDLARATGTDAATSAQILAAALNAFDLKAADAARIADLLTGAANKSAVTLVDLGESFKFAGPEAARLGMGIKDTLALLGGLAKWGVRGEMAGTTLRRLMTLTAADQDGLRRLFGVSAADAAGNARPLVDVLDEVGKALAGLGTADATARLNEFFGILGITAAAAVGRGAAGIRQLSEELTAVDGLARQTAAKMDAGIGGSLRRLLGAAEGAAVALGEALAPALVLTGAVLVVALGRLAALARENEVAAAAVGLTVVALVGLGLAAGVAGLALKGLGLVVGVVKVAVLLFTAVVALAKVALLGLAAVAAAPFVLIGALAAGIVLGAARASGALARLGDAFRGVGRIAGDTVGGIVAAIKKGDVGLAWDILLTGLSAGWLTFVVGLREAWFDFTNYFRDAFRDAVLSIRTALLDTVIAVADGINDAHAFLAGNKGLTDEGKKQFDAAKKPLDREYEALDAERKRLRAKWERDRKDMDFLLAEQKKLAPGGAGAKANAETIALVQEALDEDDRVGREIEKKIVQNMKREDQLRRNIIAGGKFIDVRPFEQAKQELIELDRQEREARNRGQQERLAGIRAERDAKLAALRDLVELANREVGPAPREVGGLPVAPMPRSAGGRGATDARLGDAARGLFQSADFRGVLGIGPASKDAIGKDQLLELRAIKTSLQNIERDGGLAFT